MSGHYVCRLSKLTHLYIVLTFRIQATQAPYINGKLSVAYLGKYYVSVTKSFLAVHNMLFVSSSAMIMMIMALWVTQSLRVATCR